MWYGLRISRKADPDFVRSATELLQSTSRNLILTTGSYIVEWNVQMAGALLAALPTLLVYIFLGRYFLRGLMAGSLKG